MKKLVSTLSVLALLATMTFGFSSCNQQNQPNQPTQTDPTKTEEPSLVGEWKLVFFEVDGQQAGSGGNMSFTFLENGTYIISDDEGIAEKGTYSQVGKTLIMESKNNDGIMKWTITELTNEVLVLSMNDSDGQFAYHFKRV